MLQSPRKPLSRTCEAQMAVNFVWDVRLCKELDFNRRVVQESQNDLSKAKFTEEDSVLSCALVPSYKLIPYSMYCKHIFLAYYFCI